MYLLFAWRYFTGKKSANAINIISWVTTGVIAFATCCQVLVLSVFNGFEDLVKSLYSSFYPDLRIIPATGKTFTLTTGQINQLKQQPGISNLSFMAEEKALLKNGDAQSVVHIRGVDEDFEKVSGVPSKLIKGAFKIGTADKPEIIIGAGIQNASGVLLDEALAPENLTIILPKKNGGGNDPFGSLSEGNVTASAVFAIQQDFDNKYVFSNIDFIKQQMGLAANEFTSAEVKLTADATDETTRKMLQKMLGGRFRVQTKFEQNSNLYHTMQLEKWAIYAVLTLILIIAAFNMVSALTMLVLEKKQDIAILQSMGSTRSLIKKIFMAEGLLLAVIGAIAGLTGATIICLLQMKYKLIKLQGGSFLIDYFPVKLMLTDFLLVAGTAMAIAIVAAWFPSYKAANQPLELG